MDKEFKQVYNPQTGAMEPVEVDSAETVRLQAAEPEAIESETAEAEMIETKVREEKSGGATIVDFNYEKYAEVERKSIHTDAVAALTLGILSLVGNLFFSLISIVLGIIGMVFGIRGQKDQEKKGMAIAGLICSIIGMVIGMLKLLGTIFFFTYVIAGDIPTLLS